MKALQVFLYHDQYFKQRYEICCHIVQVAFRELTIFRICARVRYRPQQALYDFLQKLCGELVGLKESQPNELQSLSAKSRTLEEGLKLFDEVINFSYCSHDDALPMIVPTSRHPSCSFCGGEIFRTAFCCASSCVRDDATDDMVDSKIILCNLCFVDGRGCRCGSMTPHRLQSLRGLVGLRTRIADLLGGLLDEDGSGWL